MQFSHRAQSTINRLNITQCRFLDNNKCGGPDKKYWGPLAKEIKCINWSVESLKMSIYAFDKLYELCR